MGPNPILFGRSLPNIFTYLELLLQDSIALSRAFLNSRRKRLFVFRESDICAVRKSWIFSCIDGLLSDNPMHGYIVGIVWKVVAQLVFKTKAHALGS